MFAQAAQLGISVSTFHHFTEMHLLKGPDEGHKDLVLLKVRKETKEEEKTSSHRDSNLRPHEHKASALRTFMTLSDYNQ